ncbi:hypothetical protein KJ885_03600 [Patescibacteria group bacterium]|nr:hypothetical protein [Patescibacteria group bacterium]
MELSGVRKKVFEDRYAAKDENGNPLEYAPEQMWHRVAHHVAKAEKTEEQKIEAEKKFYESLQNFKFVPAGRILSGAGAIGQKTAYNCFVIPSPNDSRGGIMDSVTMMAEIMARGGGVGVNISTLRPKGSYVKGVNGTASGAVSFGGLYSYVTGLITQGGSRRGALMLILEVEHPDIEEFITIKRDMGVITNANLSVGVSDSFMEAVKEDADWDLKWSGKVYKTVKAKYLWDLICESAWASGEPGIVFLERYNKLSNTWYFEKIISTNPCVAGDTRVSTSEGLKTIKELYDAQKQTGITLDGRLSPQKISKTTKIIQSGTKNIYKLKAREGYELKLTANHQVRAEQGWVEAKNLKPGDKILLLNRKSGFGAEGDLGWGQTLGWFVGDGHFNQSKNCAVLSFFGEEKRELAPIFAKSVNQVVAGAATCNRTYTINVCEVAGRDEARVSSQRLSALIQDAGLRVGKKLIIPASVWSGNEEMQRGFLQGLFTADGHVAGTIEKGVSVRLTSISSSLLKSVQLLLLNFGIASRIYENRRCEGKRNLSDGRGGYAPYFCKAQHDLVVSKDALHLFAKDIGFLSEAKQSKLKNLLGQYNKGPYKNQFLATFESLEYFGKEMVYDLTEPLTHSFAANGLVVHNCGEQGLGAWGVCNLGSINLSAFVKNNDLDWESLSATIKTAVHFLDNVIDTTQYYYKENEELQKSVRRVGLGTMGLADALVKLKIRYGSEQAIEFCEKLFSFIRDEAYKASIELAKIKEPFHKFNKEDFLQGKFIQTLPEDIKEDIKEFGVRNVALLTQAPTGTTSLLAGASSGIEPIFDFVVIRKDRLGEHEMLHPLYEEYKKGHPDGDLPPYLVTAKELTPEEHVEMQAIIQKYVDASISKTVNAPNSHTVEDVKKLYIMAYDLGCKGVTYFREGSRSAVVLESKTVKQTDEPEKVATLPEDREPGPAINLTPKPRPEVVSGSTYKIKTGYGTLFVTVNNDEDSRPFEVFATIGKTGGFFAAKSEAICRLISLSLRSGIDAEDVMEQLKGIRGPMPSWSKYGQVLSIPDAIGHILKQHINSAQQRLQFEYKDKNSEELSVDEERVKELPAAEMDGEVTQELRSFNYTAVDVAKSGFAPECPECRSVMEISEGCMNCKSCGYSKCS